MFLINLGYQCEPFFNSVSKWHCMSSSCCSCHILCCTVKPNQTPPSTAVGQTCCVDFVRLSLLSWLSFTCVKKWIKWECKWFLMLRTQLNALRIIYVRWLKIGLLVPPLEKHLLLTGRFGIESTNNFPLSDIFLYFYHLPAWYCIDIVRRIFFLVTHGSQRVWQMCHMYSAFLLPE